MKMPCPACKKSVKVGATKCPYCQTEYSPEQIAEMKGGVRGGCIFMAVAFVAIFLLIWACSGDEEKASPDGAASESSEAEAQSKTLAFDLPEYATRFDKFASDLDRPWKLQGVTAKDDGSFTKLMNENVAVSGNIAENGKLKGIFVIGTGDGTIKSGTDVFSVLAMAYCAARGKSDLKECGPPLMNLIKDFNEGEEPRTEIVDGVKVQYLQGASIGSMLTIDPA